MEDLVKLLNPAYLSVFMDFNSRGGISILPYSIYADEAHQDLKKAMQVALMTEITHHTPRPRF
jgi:NADPH-dependent 7-cyano-7-deazaguanine reductase QueF